MLVLAIAGGAWVLFGRDTKKSTTNAIGPKVPATAPANPVLGPVVPRPTPKATVTPTTVGPVAATKPAATIATTPAPTASAPAVVGPVATPPVVTPPVSKPQQVGTVAAKDYTFKVARGDTLWGFTENALSATGRSTSNTNLSVFVQKLYLSNRSLVGSDPNLIVPGQTIVWPAGL